MGIAYENNPTDAIKLIFETLEKNKDVLQDDKKPTVTINELATSTINIKVQFWVDTLITIKSSAHYLIRSQLMSDVVAVLITNGFSLPASIVELKNYESTDPLSVKINKS